MLLALFAALTAGTFIVGNTVSRYENTTGNLAANFPGAPGEQVISENWKRVERLDGVSFDDNSLTVSRQSPGLSWGEVRYPLPAPSADRATQLLASGTMSSRDVVVGEENWHIALFGVFFYDENNDRIKQAGKTVQALAGDASALHYERSMPVPAHATQVGVLLRLFETTGSATISNPSAVLVKPWQGFNGVLLALATVWGLFALTVLYTLAVRGSLLVALVPLAVTAAILIGVSLPGDHMRSLLLPIFSAAQGILPGDMSFGLTNIAKLGHAVGFAALAFLALALRRAVGATVLGIIWFLVLLAIATESGQLFLTGRSGRLADIGIDLAGAAVGGLIFACLALAMLPFRKRQ